MLPNLESESWTRPGVDGNSIDEMTSVIASILLCGRLSDTKPRKHETTKKKLFAWQLPGRHAQASDLRAWQFHADLHVERLRVRRHEILHHQFTREPIGQPIECSL